MLGITVALMNLLWTTTNTSGAENHSSYIYTSDITLLRLRVVPDAVPLLLSLESLKFISIGSH
jgi:hypothetical protein